VSKLVPSPAKSARNHIEWIDWSNKYLVLMRA